MERSSCMGRPRHEVVGAFRGWRMVDALGPGGQSGWVGDRATGSIEGDVVHPPVFFRNFVFDEAFTASVRIIWLKQYFDVCIT